MGEHLPRRLVPEHAPPRGRQQGGLGAEPRGAAPDYGVAAPVLPDARIIIRKGKLGQSVQFGYNGQL